MFKINVVGQLRSNRLLFGQSLGLSARIKLMCKTFLFPFAFGSLLPLAFAPFNIWPLAILSPALLLWLWQDEKNSNKHCFWQGFNFGLGMFGVGVSWVFVSIHRYGGTDIPLAIFITGLFVSILSTYLAIQGYVLKRYFFGNKYQLYLLGFPCLWVIFEWIRGVFLSGFPWLFIGYAGLDSPLAGFAPLGSVYLVSLIMLMMSGSLILILSNKSSVSAKMLASLGIVLLFGMGILGSQIPWTQPYLRPHTVSLIQANVSPLQKFSQNDPMQALEKSYGTLTAAQWGNDLILWPESAIPLPLPYVKPYIEKLDQRAKQEGSTLVTGIQVVNSNAQHFNSLIALGNGRGLYHKHHLVPFGDYLPFDQWLRGLINFFDLPMSSFSSGPRSQELIKSGELWLNPEICYEIAFPELIRETLRNAHAIITLSEDGWFGDSYGPHQHLQIARMRALETGRPVLRSTTSGITAMIDHQGKIIASAPQFQATVLSGTFQGMQGKTPWLMLGLTPLLIFCFLGFLVPGYFSKNGRLAQR